MPWLQSPDALAEVLQRLADHPLLRYQLSVQARERYLQLFARSVWTQQLERLGDLAAAGNVGTVTE